MPTPEENVSRPAGPAANRRALVRHARNLNMLWRCLGSKADTFRAATVLDISRQGIGLAVDSGFRRGTILLVKLEDVPGPFARPLLVRVTRVTERPPDGWVVGCTFATRLSADELRTLLGTAPPPAPVPAPAGTPPGEFDPFRSGGTHERRAVPRREGGGVPVVVSRPGVPGEVEGLVVDRSLGGLGLELPRPFAAGTVLQVCPARAARGLAGVRVQVKSCCPRGKGWKAGCRFLSAPPAELLLLFG